MVTINGTSFQLRTGPYRVSIIASQRLVCNDNIIFAFGVGNVVHWAVSLVEEKVFLRRELRKIEQI